MSLALRGEDWFAIRSCAMSGHKPRNLPYAWRHYVKLTPTLARQGLVKLMEYEARLGAEKLFSEA